MGVIKENYKVKGLNETLETAYGAIVGFNKVKGEKDVWKATFAIAKTRDNATEDYAYEKVSVNFVWDRACNPIPLAYEKAKEQLKDWEYDQNGRPEVITIDNVFTGWEDDIK